MKCPCCDSERSKRLCQDLKFRDGLVLNVFYCRNCGHKWIPTTPHQQAIVEKSYSADYAGFREDHFFQAVMNEEIKTRISKIMSPPARVLDVGCGNGDFLAIAQDAGYIVTGIDVSDAVVSHSVARGVSAVSGDFLTHPFETAFDLVTFWDVMEHLRDPEAFFRRTQALLCPGGYVVLKVPTPGQLHFRLVSLFKDRGGFLLGAPDHVQFFSRESLTNLLKRTGFEDPQWLSNRRFRSKPSGGSIRKRFARLSQSALSKLSGSKNLYLAARKPLEI